MATASEIGQIIKFHRGKAGLTRLQLADLAGIGKSALFDMEKGKTSVQLDTLLKVLAALNISLEPKSPLMQAWEKYSTAKSG